MCYMNSKKEKNGFMAIKVDMAKAYDRVEWHILGTIIAAHDFSNHFGNLIARCIFTVHYFILVNGSPCGFFPSTRGIRQGDPVSPALFTLVVDLLSRILARFESASKLSGVKISRTSSRITHLMYADDLVIYCKANTVEDLEVKRCLELYYSWTGQCIKWEKLEIHYSSNLGRQSRTEICRVLHMKECSHVGRYLGSPFCSFRSKNKDFNYIVEHLVAKLSGWKAKHLSLAGCTTLIKAVTSAIPSCIMQVFLLPVGLCNKIDRINRRFQWGASDGDKIFLSLRAWDSVCA